MSGTGAGQQLAPLHVS